MNELAFRGRSPAFGMLDPVVPEGDRLADFLEVVPFAGDLGEYSWFLAARRQQQETGWAPDFADSRRALVFVSGWIVRWEVFDLGYQQDRWEAHLENLAPPAVGDGTKTEIIEAQALLTREIPGHPARYHLVFTLANVPERARGPWGNWLLQALVDAAVELGEDVKFDRVQLAFTGRLLLVCALDYEADAVTRVVRRGVDLTDERYRSWSESKAQRVRELQRLQDAFRRVIFAARSGNQLFATVDVSERGADGKAEVRLGFNLGESKVEELGHCADGFRSMGGPLVSTGVVQDKLVFEAFELDEDGEALVREAVRRCEEIVLHHRAHQNRRVLQFQRFQNRLGELFPSSE
jgi:hypothetical protein